MDYFSLKSICFALTILFLYSCGKPSAKRYAQQFCTCSANFSTAAIELKRGKITKETYAQLDAEHTACMGDDDPLEILKDQPEELLKFKAEFIEELEIQCPEIARNMGY